MKWVMVLEDGTTYSQLDGCAIVAVPDYVTDEDMDEFVGGADGYYCFGTQPGIESNNGQTLDDLIQLEQPHIEKCEKCGAEFNLNSGFDRISLAQHKHG